METLTQWFQKIMASAVWSTLLERIEWVDCVTVTFIILGLIYGAKQGLLRELAEIVELILAIFFVFTYQENCLVFFKAIFRALPPKSLPAFSFLSLMLLVGILIALVDNQLRKLVHTKLIGFIRITGGMVLGIVQMLILWSFISQVIILLPDARIRRFYEEGYSLTGVKVKAIAPSIYKKVTRPAESLPGKAKSV